MNSQTSATSAFPKTAVVVVGTNEKKWLFNCFDSLSQSNYPALQIIYVDNNSDDGSVDYLRSSFPNILIIRNSENKGFAGANNVGMKYAVGLKSKYIFLVNPDTISQPDLISKLVRFMEMHPKFGIIGPLQSNYNDFDKLNDWSNHALKNQDKSVFHHWNSWKPNISTEGEDKITDILEHAYVQGAAFFLRAEILDKIGYFEEIFHTFYEEVDLCRKTRWIGYRVALLLDVKIQHFGGGDSKNSDYRNYHYTRNKYIYLLTDPEYTHFEILNLSLRWLIHDFKGVIKKTSPDISNTRQFLNMFFWLVTNPMKLKRIRNSNFKLFTSKSYEKQ